MFLDYKQCINLDLISILKQKCATRPGTVKRLETPSFWNILIHRIITVSDFLLFSDPNINQKNQLLLMDKDINLVLRPLNFPQLQTSTCGCISAYAESFLINHRAGD